MSPWLSIRFLQTQSDEQLLAAARQGHERAFEALVRRHRGALLGHARRLLPDVSAEDAMQQGLLQAWTALQRGAEVRLPRAWLHRVVHNAAVDILRGCGDAHDELGDSDTATGAASRGAEEPGALREVLSAIAGLPAIQREALLRTAVEGHSHEHVAVVLGVSAGAVRGLVYRARATLRAAASALTPPPIAAWAARAARRAAAAGHPFANLAVGGREGGITRVLLRGAAAALSSGVVAVAAVPIARHIIHAQSARQGSASRGHDTASGRRQMPPGSSEAPASPFPASRSARSPVRGVATGMKSFGRAGPRSGGRTPHASSDAGAETNADAHAHSPVVEQGPARGSPDDGHPVAGAEIASTHDVTDGSHDSNAVSGPDTSGDGGGSGGSRSSPPSDGGSGAGAEATSDGGGASGGSQPSTTDGSGTSAAEASAQGSDGGSSGVGGDGPSVSAADLSSTVAAQSP